MGEVGSGPFRSQVELTALNGDMALALRIPLWFLVFIAVAASALQLMGNTRAFAVSRGVQWLVAVFGVVWVIAAYVLIPAEFSVGLGWFCGLGSAVLPLICLFLTVFRSQDEGT